MKVRGDVDIEVEGVKKTCPCIFISLDTLQHDFENYGPFSALAGVQGGDLEDRKAILYANGGPLPSLTKWVDIHIAGKHLLLVFEYKDGILQEFNKFRESKAVPSRITSSKDDSKMDDKQPENASIQASGGYVDSTPQEDSGIYESDEPVEC